MRKPGKQERQFHLSPAFLVSLSNPLFQVANPGVVVAGARNMYRMRSCLCASVLVFTISGLAVAQEAIDADVLLSGGLVVDGSGAEGAVGDVAIMDGEIVAVGKFPRGTIGQTIDCQGMI